MSPGSDIRTNVSPVRMAQQLKKVTFMGQTDSGTARLTERKSARAFLQANRSKSMVNQSSISGPLFSDENPEVPTEN